ncbi:hypothetical protein [Corynebacterium mayonis]|uniref:hypothetical protein n=1 Tax=Corynebacterium mayonis TaxID=3062461 RepID=UPI0031407DC6
MGDFRGRLGQDQVTAPEKANAFEDLVKFIPRVEELKYTNYSEESMTSFIDKFAQAAADFAVNNPAAVLGGKNVTRFIATIPAEELTTDQARALLGQVLTAAELMGNAYVEKLIEDGYLGRILKRLEELGRA